MCAEPTAGNATVNAAAARKIAPVVARRHHFPAALRARVGTITRVRKLVWVPAVAVVVVAGGAVGAMNVYDHKQRDRIAPGIMIGKVAVGNLTAVQAREKVTNSL